MVGGTFLRVKVEVDVSKPLCKGRKVALNDDTKIWVSFKYEKLPNFCYWCGMVSHVDRECDVWLSGKGSLGLDQQGYGNWLRVAPFNLKKTIVTTVSRVGNGFGLKAGKYHQPSSDDNPATTHGGGASIVTEQVTNPGCPYSGEELPSPTLPKINALNEEINSIPKPPTAHNYHVDHDMQLNGIDLDITNIEIGDNISDAITPNLMTPTHVELNGEIIGGIMQSVPPSHTKLKGEYLGPINANQNSSTSDPHVPRKWKRLKRGPHA